MKFKSNASWTKNPDSSDTHDSLELAEGICERLIKEYGVNTIGCSIRGHCLKAWVTEKDGE